MYVLCLELSLQASTLSLVLLGQLLTTFIMDTLLQDAIPARLLNISMVLFGVLLTGVSEQAVRSKLSQFFCACSIHVAEHNHMVKG